MSENKEAGALAMALQWEEERSGALAEALQGEYQTSARWKRDYEAAAARLAEALYLLAEAWEWTARDTPGKEGYVDLERRVKAVLERGKV